MSIEGLLSALIWSVIGLYGITLGQFALLWHRIGRLEGKANKKGVSDGKG